MLWLLALLLPLATLITAGPVNCPLGQSLCFQAYPTPNNSHTIDLVISTTLTQGWVSVGLGSGMRQADVWMLLRGPQDSSWTLQERRSSRHDLPDVVSNPSVSLVGVAKAAQGSGYTFLLRRPAVPDSSASITDPLQNSQQSFIGALYDGEAAVSAQNIPQHTGVAGAWKYNVFDATGAPADGSSIPDLSISSDSAGSGGDDTSSMRTRAVLIHAVCMAIAWTVLPYAAIFVARFLKARLGHRWFVTHIGLFSLVAVLSTVGFSFIVATSDTNWDSAHAVLGLILFSIMWCQVVLGVVIDRLWTPDRARIPWWDKLHWVLGYSLAIGTLVNVGLGHVLNGTSTGLIVFNYVVVAAWIPVFIWGQRKLGKEGHGHGGEVSEEAPAKAP
ncbi:hypothetical protein RI367_001966 [Sorochytrium milnesiophthora]